MNGIRGSVLNFAANHMEPVLQKNDFKGGWQYMKPREIEYRLKQEMAELVTEMRRKNPDMDKINREAADVANFCMFIVDNNERKMRDEA